MTRRNSRAAIVSGLILSAMLLTSTFAHADAPRHAAERSASGAGDVALAETLFQMGKKLMQQGNYSEACDKFTESLRQDPGAGGTQLALAACHEKLGKTATAWAEYNTAASMARRDHRQDRLKYASKHLEKLEGILSRLTVQVPPEVTAISGVRVLRDGVSVPRAVWNVPVPVDPGEHLVRVQAPGYEPWNATVTVGPRSDTQVIEVTPLSKTQPEKSHETRLPTHQTTSPTSKRNVPSPSPWGYLAGGVGLLAVGIGSFTGWQAIALRDEVEDACPNNRCASQADIDTNDQARTSATVSTVSFAIGLVGIGTAAVMLWPESSSDKNDENNGVRVVSSVSEDSGFVGLRGAW